MAKILLMTNNDHMDALALTSLCLRVALAVDLQYGYVPLDVAALDVREETKQQHKAGMVECDCSTCQLAEAEGLWLTHPAITNEKIDSSLDMNKSKLAQLVEDLPDPPPPPTVEVRTVAMVCGSDDPVLDAPWLKGLVTWLEHMFISFFYITVTEPLDLGLDDYFGRNMAWNVTKNIDIIAQPSNFELVLGTWPIPGQFDHLFVAFSQWQNKFCTDAAIGEASTQGAAAYQANSSNKIPQSFKGAQMAKDRAEEEKRVLKVAHKKGKEAEAVAKVVAQEQCKKDKKSAIAHKLSQKESVIKNHNVMTGQKNSKDYHPKCLKCVAEENLEG
ncbi:uncharacterized protein MELLADRAFT_63439 [Melampsora larici-populina 98AG31]|uniref:Uncharacterized protein n=1 Tax=Melampsora larici-populina (strain 98AG31 / pathotype 3-4-7) TaxID=747676 RepID=F4RMM7_MELLP|nr:uncharacterized protein MELLADRAFT_63439 [Melampsora larici-populina 98AG31]EGG06354.1 hypothetical protein MELLADRAFT_63439 [Melampsora larici-populina 98AG31]